MVNLFDPLADPNEYDENMAIFSGVNLHHENVMTIAEGMIKIIDSLFESMQDHIKQFDSMTDFTNDKEW